MVDHDQRIGKLIQPAEVAGTEVEAALGRDAGFVPLGPIERGQDVCGIEIAAIRRTGPGPALAVDEELVEIPLALLDAGDGRLPDLPVPLLPARDRPPA